MACGVTPERSYSAVRVIALSIPLARRVASIVSSMYERSTWSGVPRSTSAS